MKIQAPFGFVTGCHAGDRHIVQASLASMRHYAPQVPICLVVDGSFDVSDLEKEYKLFILRPAELEDKEMRQMLCGSFHAKQAALFEGPFERFVWMDSDAILWGDITDQIRQDIDFQILWNEVSIKSDEKNAPPWLSHFYFNPEILSKIDPIFDWRGHPYFSAGVYAARRNVIRFEEYKKCIQWENAYPGLFAFGDMGILNYLILSKKRRGEIKVEMTDLQHIPLFHGVDEIIKDCKGYYLSFPKKIKRPRILHFCGKKPWIYDIRIFQFPYTIARLEHNKTKDNLVISFLKILWIDTRILLTKIIKRFKK